MMKAFDNCNYNKLHLTFPNGNRISTTWGYCTYSDNHDVPDEENPMDKFNKFRDSNTVEIMILECPDKLREKIEEKYNFDENIVKGYLNITEWLEIVNLLAK